MSLLVVKGRPIAQPATLRWELTAARSWPRQANLPTWVHHGKAARTDRLSTKDKPRGRLTLNNA
jgi:hypothetical protein